MPVVTKEQLKIWFSNFKKPPEGEFWAWLDSFRHILDKVPLDDVDGLKGVLSKKADLVNGVVPEDQLPFSVVTSEVITLGLVEQMGNKIYLRVHSSGANKVRVKGKLITRAFQNQWTITPIVADGVKVLRGYAVKSGDDFLLAEGAELPTYKEPEIPEEALEIFKITMRSSGNIIEHTEPGLKYIAEDGWRNVLLTEDLTVLRYNFGLKSSYWVNSAVANPVIGGIHNGLIDKNASPKWDGKEFWLFNNTGGDLELNSTNVTAIDVYLFSDKLMPLTIKNNNAVLLKLKDNVIEVMQGGGGASFPELGNDGEVLVKDTAIEGGAKWSNRLNIAEDEIDTEIVNRALADGILQNQITANLNTRSNVVDKMLHYWDAIAGKWISSKVQIISDAVLKLKSVIFENYTILQRDSISNLEEGRLIYVFDTDFKGFQVYKNGAWVEIANSKLDKPTANGIFNIKKAGSTLTFENVLNSDFDSAINQFFVNDLAIMRPIQFGGTSYSNFNWSAGNTLQAGASRPSFVFINYILYSSSGATLGRVHGNQLRFFARYTFSVYRKFTINTNVSTQRVFVGFTDNWRQFANPTNVAMVTLNAVLGFCMESGNPNILLVFNNITGSANIIDTNIVHDVNNVYEIFFTHIYLETTVTAKLRKSSREGIIIEEWTYTINSEFSLSGHSPALWCVDALEAATVQVSDFGVLQMKQSIYLA